MDEKEKDSNQKSDKDTGTIRPPTRAPYPGKHPNAESEKDRSKAYDPGRPPDRAPARPKPKK